jgi:hypothetical protein
MTLLKERRHVREMTISTAHVSYPKKSVHTLGREGVLGDEVSEKREGRSAFIRKVEVDVVLDLKTAQHYSFGS